MLRIIHGIKRIGEEAHVCNIWHGRKTKGATLKFVGECISVTRKYGSAFHFNFFESSFFLSLSPLVLKNLAYTYVHNMLAIHFSFWLPLPFCFQNKTTTKIRREHKAVECIDCLFVFDESRTVFPLKLDTRQE